MTRRGLVLDDGTLRLEFLRTAAETGGELHEMRARYAPNSRWPPAHHHPAQEERFLVREGQLEFRLDGEPRRVAAGKEGTVPAGVVHQVRNDADVPAVAIWQTRPAGRTAAFYQAIHGAQVHGTLLDVAREVDAYDDVFRLDIRPRRIVRGAVTALACLARLVNNRRPPAAVRPSSNLGSREIAALSVGSRHVTEATLFDALTSMLGRKKMRKRMWVPRRPVA